MIKPIFFLMGPTASGKTDAALRLTEQFPFEIISVDSALVYRGMDIGTSKPSQELRERVPHHLIDICDPLEHYSAAQFRRDTIRLIEDIHLRGKIPLLAGGTMLYFRALEYGLSDLPEADENIRAELDKDIARYGLAAMHERLRLVDAGAASVIKPTDPQRIQRALEVYLLTGTPISEWWEKNKGESLPYDIYKIALMLADRRVLHTRIEQRFDQMLAFGFVDEVKRLFARGDLAEALPSIRSVGYRQAWQYLQGRLSYEGMREKAIIATRQLAKRQLTWLRKEQNLQIFFPEVSDFHDSLLKFVESGLTNKNHSLKS